MVELSSIKKRNKKGVGVGTTFWMLAKTRGRVKEGSEDPTGVTVNVKKKKIGQKPNFYFFLEYEM